MSTYSVCEKAVQKTQEGWIEKNIYLISGKGVSNELGEFHTNIVNHLPIVESEWVTAEHDEKPRVVMTSDNPTFLVTPHGDGLVFMTTEINPIIIPLENQYHLYECKKNTIIGQINDDNPIYDAEIKVKLLTVRVGGKLELIPARSVEFSWLCVIEGGILDWEK